MKNNKREENSYIQVKLLGYQLIYQPKILQDRRECDDILKVVKGKKKFITKNTHLPRLFSEYRKHKEYPNDQKLKEFITTNTVLQEMLKGLH